jgi:hypothetical protein
VARYLVKHRENFTFTFGQNWISHLDIAAQSMELAFVLNQVPHHKDVSALHGGEWSASRPGRFTPGTHWIEGGGRPEPFWTQR